MVIVPVLYTLFLYYEMTPILKYCHEKTSNQKTKKCHSPINFNNEIPDTKTSLEMFDIKGDATTATATTADCVYQINLNEINSHLS